MSAFAFALAGKSSRFGVIGPETSGRLANCAANVTVMNDAVKRTAVRRSLMGLRCSISLEWRKSSSVHRDRLVHGQQLLQCAAQILQIEGVGAVGFGFFGIV